MFKKILMGAAQMQDSSSGRVGLRSVLTRLSHRVARQKRLGTSSHSVKKEAEATGVCSPCLGCTRSWVGVPSMRLGGHLGRSIFSCDGSVGRRYFLGRPKKMDLIPRTHTEV